MLNNAKSKSKKLTAFLFILLFSFPVYAEKIIQGIIQDSENIVIAKGDIPTPKKFETDILSYREKAVEQLTLVEKSLDKLIENSEKNQLINAQNAYQQAHYHYEVIRPIIALFGSSERLLNNRADFFLERENSPRFSGFHLVEYQLFKLRDPQNATESAKALLRGISDLKKRVAIEDIPIPKLVQSAGDNLEFILTDKLAGIENQYSNSDLGDSYANLSGSRLIVEILSNHIPTAEYQSLIKQYDDIGALLLKYQRDEGLFQPLTALPETEKSWLFSQVTQLAEQVANLRSTLNIDVYYHYKEASDEK
ncbi:EfeM/EfeO family lipoprotein [Proteus terrae subsp. cibarius]|uniref:EfeM/EfeO family lipoprotein n=1 Tax=Proteus terrae subsp. cibarius TaxID=626774 RepID=A0A6G6SAU7_9GAMM|nr:MULTISPECIES: EfeM/EfeO family lipoprotein [Proteus]QHP75487.1 EfeM/EfeO family lipoprotein [Proteus vulgaris]MBG2913548.1 EfeM/EfeO family lipoprotein [Proteus terrae subsp. cibarius]MBG3089221.1 EfeM/EfeO family lipoprotein [Proteus terrae subsp. cibarius]MCM2367707.1 EfeM/EfeO family lipoprotein [Proteus sp. FZP2095]MCO4182674.1 EfeM/EfeO family lipoprotein [Proteus terrae]